MTDDDWSLAEVVRSIQRLDGDIQGCVTETSYAKAQTETGRRFEEQTARIQTIENERKAEVGDRARQRQGLILAVTAASLSFAFSLGVKVIELAAG